MSQYPYPSPYQPPTPSYSSYLYAWEEYHELILPARRASNLMFVLGALGLVAALSCLGVRAAIPWSRLPPELAESFNQLETQTHVPAATFITGVAAIMGIPSVLLIALGFWVRRASKVAIYLAASLVVLILIVLALNILRGLTDAVRIPQAAPQAIFGTCMVLVPTALFGLLLVWLSQAARNATTLREAQARYQAQYWQYLQQQQQYAQPLGMPYPMQPPPPPPSVPPAMTPPPPVPHRPTPPPPDQSTPPEPPHS
ncbi:MAG TPA: hypothetical protein VHP11_07910 [Tepidisphaeraceae bacterium]|nr:hypothetical protein [Tepidisphaeraceae bacterium]